MCWFWPQPISRSLPRPPPPSLWLRCPGYAKDQSILWWLPATDSTKMLAPVGGTIKSPVKCLGQSVRKEVILTYGLLSCSTPLSLALQDLASQIIARSSQMRKRTHPIAWWWPPLASSPQHVLLGGKVKLIEEHEGSYILRFCCISIR